MVLELSSTAKASSDVGHIIVTNSSKNSAKYSPSMYKVVSVSVGSNSANFSATTSYIGTVYYAVVITGTPTNLISRENIYNRSLSSGVSYGSSSSALESSGVNIVSDFVATELKAQTTYTLAAYLNSTLGNSPIYFLNFTTAKISNAAAIRIAMSSPVNESYYIDCFSKVLRINSSRIYILTNKQILSQQQTSFQAVVMNQRYYIYDTLVAPNPRNDDSRPLSILKNFAKSSNAKNMLAEFVPEYIKSYDSTVREVFCTVPKVRIPIKIIAKTYESVTFSVAFWGPVFVYAIVIENTTQTLLSSQVVNGFNENNTQVTQQHYANVTTDEKGFA